jgi:hypothetical protein
MSDQIDVPRLRKAITRELEQSRRRNRIGLFIGHLILAIVFNIILLGVALTNQEFMKLLTIKESPLALLLIYPPLLGAFGLMFHGISTFGNLNKINSQSQTAAIMRAFSQEILEGGEDEGAEYEKPKRRAQKAESGTVQLTDDGELIAADDVKQAVSNQVKAE